MNMAGKGFTTRLKYLSTINDEVLDENTSVDFEMQYIDIGNVDSSGCINALASYRFEDAPSRARRRVRDGDVIISTVRTYLQAITQIHDPPENLIVSTGFAVVRPLRGKFDANYCRFALREPSFLAEVKKRSVGVSYPAITASDLAGIPIYTYPLPQQRAIADYLDRETGRMDALVAAKERLLKLLVEKRQALITRAATRGLDPNVRLKPSGVEWLGDVPAHWQIKKLRSLFKLHGSGTTPMGDHYFDGDVPWVMIGDLNDGILVDTKRTVTDSALQEYSALKMYPKNSLVIAMYGSIGMTGILSMEACVNQACCVLADPLKDTEPIYVQAVINIARHWLSHQGYGGVQMNINAEIVRAFRLPVPPIAEQAAIVKYLGRETANLDALAAKARETIALLKERRAALISAAVTGKIDVRIERAVDDASLSGNPGKEGPP